MNLTRMEMYVTLVVVAALAMTVGVTSCVWETWVTPGAHAQSNNPLRLTFYYPWFPGHWNESTHYHPTLGNYDSSSPIVIRNHIDAMQYARIDAAIVSWWGWRTQGEYKARYGTDAALREILKESRGSGFRWAIHYEWEGPVDNIPRNPSRDEIVSDLDYLYANFANDPSYLHIDGRWVLFVYSDENDGCEMVSRWSEAKTTHPEAYVVLRVFQGYLGCASQPDGWYQYSTESGSDSQSDYSYTISPGFWSAIEDHPRLERNLARWKANIGDMISSGATFQLVSTFNEWGEGTAVESAEEWATASGYGAYLDALHSNGYTNGDEWEQPNVRFAGVVQKMWYD